MSANEMNNGDDAGHILVSLSFAVFLFYSITSAAIFLYKTLKQETLYLISLTIILLTWTLKEQVIDFISPTLLRLFGAGGQGYLHLLSLWVVDPRDLSVVGVATRVLAGSYSAILAAIFFIPLLSAIWYYVFNLYDALTPSEVTVVQQQREILSPTPLVHRPRISTSSVPHQNNNIQDEFLLQERWLLKEFNMHAFNALCPLGKGVTSAVVLARVNPKIGHEEITIQQGSLFIDSHHDNNNNHLRNDSTDIILDTQQIIRQEGSLWAENEPKKISNNKNNVEITKGLPRAKPSATSIKTSSWSSFGVGNFFNEDERTVENENNEELHSLHDSLLQEIGEEEEESQSENNVSTSRLRANIKTKVQLNKQKQQSIDAFESNHISHYDSDTIQMKMRRNPQSVSALSELAGLSAEGGGDDTYYRPLQFLTDEQRIQSGMDKLFAPAPGLASNPLSLAEVANLIDERNSTTGSNTDGEKNTPTMGGGGGGINRIRRGSESSNSVRSLRNLRLSNFPSVLSFTDSEIINLDNNNNYLDEDGLTTRRRLLKGLEEMPDLVAIKIMHKVDIERMGMRKTVENERRALAMCASPFVCNLYGGFQDNFWAYLLLEPVPAGDLAGLLEQTEFMPEEDARFYVGSLLLALEHLHERGICCLDVKPENLLLDEYGYCKLCDLGISKIFLSSGNLPATPKGSGGGKIPCWEFIGTPEYMAPEVVCRDPIHSGMVGIAGPDLWACGILLFELLTGETPFAGETNSEVVKKIQKFVFDEKNARTGQMSRYQRWANRVRRTSDDGSMDTDDDPIIDSNEIDFVFQPISRASPAAKDLIRKLLRPNPRRRLGCRDLRGAATALNHDWFKSYDIPSLRKRLLKAPFIPNPITLAPPFQGVDLDLDFIKEKPMSIAELQACQNFLKCHNQTENMDAETWKGFSPIQTAHMIVPGDISNPNFLKSVQHVQKFFREND